jgi:predicted alpha/beta hydrolase family esterase
MSARPVLIVPGLGGSGPGHWQTLWQAEIPGAVRVEQADWDEPRRDRWIGALENAIAANPGAIVVAHSLGCILLAHLAALRAIDVAGALLVAPADVERPMPAPGCVRRFAPVPISRLPFASIVVASSNDPYATSERAAAFAHAWGSDFVDIGDAGHINVASGYGAWADGRVIFDRLRERIAR